MTKYVQLLQKLNYVNKFCKNKKSLESIQSILQRMGDPQKKVKYIHVGGTNGKGSVSLKISKALEFNGLKTGLYTSPHLFYYGERVQINGQFWEEDFVADCLERLFIMTEKHQIPLTFFDYLTVLMFQYFAEKQVDIGVLEVGLGGKMDSTNIIENPLASVITSIGLDHTEILGKTLHEIAINKAGIIKQNCPTIIGPCCEPLEVFEGAAKQVNSELVVVKSEIHQLLDYNIENRDIAREAINTIKRKHPDFAFLDNGKIEKGILAQQKCRMEPLSQEFLKNYNAKMIYFDVGHNPAALEKLMLRLKKFHPGNRIRAVFGTSSLKDASESLIILSQNCYKIHLISSNHFRSMKIEQLVQCSDNLKRISSNSEEIIQEVISNGNIKSTLDHVMKITNNSEIIIICGSFFLQTEARSYFNIQDKLDAPELSLRKE